MLSTIALVELEVLRITSAPPRCSKAFSVADNFIRTEIPDHFVFIGRMGYRESLEARSLGILHRQVPKPTDPQHGHALMQLGIGPAEAAIDCVTGTEYRGCLLVGNLVGNQIGGV